MRRWPPILWPVMSVATLLILMGLGPWKRGALIAGLALAVAVCATAAALATRGLRDRPRARALRWATGSVIAFYVLAAALAATAGAAYAVAALAAGLIPLSAVLLLVATMRSKTAESGGRRRDESAAAHGDPFPGLGID